MKKIALLSLISLLAFASCKKDHLEEVPSPQSAETPAVATQVSTWKAVENWTGSNNSFSASLSDESISSDVAQNGLVLLYAKDNTIQLLPGKVGKTYFYYQVQEGSIQINANSDVNKALQFSYVVFSKDELSSLEQKGVSRSQLMNMSYEQVSQLKN